jgi:hypothetical protein
MSSQQSNPEHIWGPEENEPGPNPTRPVAGVQDGPGSAGVQQSPPATNLPVDQQPTIPVHPPYSTPEYPAHPESEIELLKESYEAVRLGRVTDPDTIRTLAVRFEEHVYDPNLDFYPLRAAEILYSRARYYEELKNLRRRFPDEPIGSRPTEKNTTDESLNLTPDEMIRTQPIEAYPVMEELPRKPIPSQYRVQPPPPKPNQTPAQPQPAVPLEVGELPYISDAGAKEKKWEKSRALQTIREANPVGESVLVLNDQYYTSVLQQAKRSFVWALCAAVIGLLFFMAAVAFLLLRQPQNVSYISVICGALVEAISALNFYLYGQASRQLVTFHLPLERTQRFILANTICESLHQSKEAIRAKLVLALADVPVSLENQEEKGWNERNEQDGDQHIQPVPNLYGLDLITAAERAREFGMKVVPVGEVSSYPNIKPGGIVSQNPMPGIMTQVASDDPEQRPEIHVYLSKRPYYASEEAPPEPMTRR